MKLLISFISYKTTDTYLFQLIILDILLHIRHSITTSDIAKFKERRKLCNII